MIEAFGKYRFVIWSMLVAVAVASILFGGAEVFSNDQWRGIWSANSKPPYVGPEFTPVKIPSPNGTLSINATKEGLSLGKGNKILSHLNILINPPLTEVLWAPDSHHFAVNVSDGGLVGTWETKVYTIDSDDRPIDLDIDKKIRSISANLFQCDSKEEPNVGAVAWLDASKEILIVMEVPPHSSCRNMGHLFGFRVSVKSGKIVERISEAHLLKKWAHVLGVRFVKR